MEIAKPLFNLQFLIVLISISPSLAQNAPKLENVKIAFVSYRTGTAEIYLMNSDGTEVEQITDSPDNNSFPFQIDKRTIGFKRIDSDRNVADLQIDIFTKAESLQKSNPIQEGAKWESLSPNGQYVAFVRSNDYSDRELFIYDTETKTEKRITSKEDDISMAYSINHKWSPDGKQLAFISGPDWYNQFIRIYDLKTKNLRTVTSRGYMNSGLLWLKDNETLIANIKVRDSTIYELYRLDVKTGKPIQLTENANLHPNISPDGDWIVFESQRHGDDGEVYIMRPDGSSQIRLTENNTYDGRCTWFETD